MFAGLGRRAHPAAVRDRAQAGRRRSSSSTSSTPSAAGAGPTSPGEKDQTLNQLLVEMDGFSSTDERRRDRRVEPARQARPGAAAPRPLRPPDLRLAARRPRARADPRACTRATSRWPTSTSRMIARQTSGLTGADLANICNEAAIFAARRDSDVITTADFDAALERVVAGMQSRRTLNDHERRVVAYHEAGHALCAELLPAVDRVHKISIVPRGRALGLHAQPARRGPLPQDARGARRLHDDAARRPRRREDRVRRDHHRRLGRPQARRDISRVDGPRVRDGHRAGLAAR